MCNTLRPALQAPTSRVAKAAPIRTDLRQPHKYAACRFTSCDLYIHHVDYSVRFAWDSAKSTRNYRARGFDFGAATQIFAGFTLERPDTRRDYGETRVITIGRVADVTLTVIYTDRQTRAGTVVRRIISARRSNRHERSRYEVAQASSK